MSNTASIKINKERYMKKSVNLKLFCGTVGMTVINIVLLVAFISGCKFGPHVLWPGCIAGYILALILNKKINTVSYNKDDNYDAYFTAVLALNGIVFISWIFLF